MPQKSKRSIRSQSSARRLRYPCLALVLSDGSARRKKERAHYRRSATQLERETSKLKVFEEQDGPQFARWLEQECADLLTPLRQAMMKISDLERLEYQVHTLASDQGLPLWQAYDKIETARQAGTLDQLFAYQDAPDDDEDAESLGTSSDDEELFQEFCDLAREMFGVEFAEDDSTVTADAYTRDDHQRAAWEPRESAHTKPGERDGDAYLKGLYRQLVRVLHPDAGVEMTAERQRQWGEVQDAYTWGDVHRLMRLHAQICGGDPAGPKLDLDTMPIGDIIALRRPIDRRLRQVRASLSVAKKEICWGFAALLQARGRQLSVLRSNLRRDLGGELQYARGRQEKLERVVASWAKGPRKPAVNKPSPSKSRGQRRHRAEESRYREPWFFD